MVAGNMSATAATAPTRDETGRNLVSISPFFIVKGLQTSVAFYCERVRWCRYFLSRPAPRSANPGSVIGR